MQESASASTTVEAPVEKTVFIILFAISFSHLLNDMVQSLMPAIYPIIKTSFHLNFSQIGIITLVFQLKEAYLRIHLMPHGAKGISFSLGLKFC